jgi:uncharacterized protein (AIM24 family)
VSTLTTCDWCGTQFPVEQTSCPRCGAGADVRNAAAGGWVEAPAIKDMAEVQLGRSRAQIEGLMVPVVDVRLADGDSVFCTHDKLLWHDGTAKLSTKKGGIFKSLRSGTPLTLMAATGPGRVAFSDNHAGELVAMPIDAGETVVSRQGHMLLATGNVDYDGYKLDLWYETETVKETSEGREVEREIEYPAGNFEQFKTGDGQPGLVMLQAVGNVFVRKLSAGEVVDVAPHSLLAWRGSVRSGLMIERKPWTGLHHHYISLRVEGPGTVWIQSGSMGHSQENHTISRVSQSSVMRDI